jgi:hypothetical protein
MSSNTQCMTLFFRSRGCLNGEGVTKVFENYTFLTIVADRTGLTIVVAARTRNDCRFSNESIEQNPANPSVIQ